MAWPPSCCRCPWPRQSPEPPAPSPQAPSPSAAAGAFASGSGPRKPAPAPKLPPAGSPPLVRFIQITFPTQGDVSVVEPRTYLYYIQTQVSRPSDGVWVPYDEKTEASLLEDFKRLWATNFLDDLSIEVIDAPYDNGVMGKRIIYKMEERQRVKIVDYTGSKKLDQTKIEEKLKEENILIRLDSFIDPGQIRKVESVVRSFMASKGYQYAEVTHELKPLPSGPKLVNLTFNVEEGPKVKIKKIEFEGNKAMSDGDLAGEMKHNKAAHWLSFITSRGVYQEAMFEEDADRIQAFYRDKGYISARVGQPEIKILQDEKDGKTRNVELKVPVTEGDRYRVGSLDFEGNKVVKTEGLRPLFKLKEGDYYSEKLVRKGMEVSRELYGSVGYWEFTGYPDLKPRNMPDPEKANDPAAIAEAKKQPAIVDVTMKMQEGEQYFVNRITFQGNTTTRDNVIRREIRLLENGVFNTEALKFSVKRINQLGYFKQIEEGSDVVKVEKTPGEKNKVNVTLKFEEQNRNQLTFGAGVSQYEGFFGQLAFQTSNFLGRGESATFSVLAGARVRNYQLAFTEPFLFDRPITAGFDLYSARDSLLLLVHAGLDRRQPHDGLPGRQLLAHVPRLPAGGVAREGPRPGLHRPGSHRAQPVPGRCAAHQRGRQAADQPGHAQLRPQHDRQPDFPQPGQALHAGHRPCGPRRQHQLHQAAGRGRVLAAHHQEDDAGHAGPVRVHPALWEHDRVADLRAAVPGRRVQHPGLRHPHHRAARHRHAENPGPSSCWAATSRRCSTRSTSSR